MSERLNFYSGTFSLDPQNAEQIKADLADFTADLASIEYIADIHARREDIVKVLNAVRIRYAAELDGDDFLQTISATDQTTDLESIRTYQDVSERDNVLSTTDIRSFDMNYSGEIVGRMPTQLRGKFETYNDTGADSFKFGSSRSTVLTVTEAGASATTGSMDATFNSVSEDVPDLVSLTSGYDNLNLMAGAVARALSSQFPNSNNDQNLLKILVEQASYENLMKIALGGCTTTTGSTVSIQSLLHSNTVAKGHGINMRDLKDKVFDENLPSSRALGHEILLAIFDKCPASLGDDSGAGRTVSYLGEDNTTAQRPWQIVSLVGTDQDGLKLEYAANLINQATGNKIDITLQFVLKTKLTMTLRDGTSLQTLESPASSGGGSGSGSGTLAVTYNTSSTYSPPLENLVHPLPSDVYNGGGGELGYFYPTTGFFYLGSDGKITEGIAPHGIGFRVFIQTAGNYYGIYEYEADETSASVLDNTFSFWNSTNGPTHARKWWIMVGSFEDDYNNQSIPQKMPDAGNFSHDDGSGGWGQMQGNMPAGNPYQVGPAIHRYLNGIEKPQTYEYVNSGSVTKRLSPYWRDHYLARNDHVFGYATITLEDPGTQEILELKMEMNKPLRGFGEIDGQEYPGIKYFVPIRHDGANPYDYTQFPTTILVAVNTAERHVIEIMGRPEGDPIPETGVLITHALIEFPANTKIYNGLTISNDKIVGYLYSVGDNFNVYSGSTINGLQVSSSLPVVTVADSGLNFNVAETRDERLYGQTDALYSPYSNVGLWGYTNRLYETTVTSGDGGDASPGDTKILLNVIFDRDV